jgi:hypothetical protein
MQGSYSMYDSPVRLSAPMAPIVEFGYYDDFTNALVYKNNLLEFFEVNSITELTSDQRNDYERLVSTYKSPATIRIGDVRIESTNKLFDFTTDYFVPPFVEPSSNFTEIESFTYFNTPGGLISIPKIEYTRVGNSIQTDKGTWNKGTTYNRNDVVTQENQSGAASSGNDLEFVCLAEDGFVSYLPPSSDPKNWSQANYVVTETFDIRKAVLIGDKVQLVSLDYPRDPVQGYLSTHFKFKRDMRRGIINHQWLGCTQTIDTTSDGKSPVEILDASGDVLVVNGNNLVQNTIPQAGPILDVR